MHVGDDIDVETFLKIGERYVCTGMAPSLVMGGTIWDTALAA